MVFQHVGADEQRLVESTVDDTSTIRNYCSFLLDGLKGFFDQSHIRVKFDVSFTFDEKLVSAISTPFGDARGRLVIQIVGGEILGRYVFEKNTVSELGQDAWIPVWAIRVSRYGNVFLGDEGSIEIDVQSRGPHRGAMNAAGRSLLYSIGATPTFAK